MPRKRFRVPNDVRGRGGEGVEGGGVEVEVSGVESFSPRPLFREIICHSDYKSMEEFYDVTILMKPLQQYFHVVLCILYVVLTFESVDEILWCHHSNEISLAEILGSSI